MTKNKIKAVRPKIGIREKHQGNHGKYSKKLGKKYVKHEETYKELGGTCRELPLRGFLNHLVSHQFSSRFTHCWIHPRMTAEYALWTCQYIAVHFFMVFSHMISHAKLILMTIGGEWRSVTFVLLFQPPTRRH